MRELSLALTSTVAMLIFPLYKEQIINITAILGKVSATKKCVRFNHHRRLTTYGKILLTTLEEGSRRYQRKGDTAPGLLGVLFTGRKRYLRTALSTDDPSQ